METIPITFSELRRSTEVILHLLHNACGCKEANLRFKAGIEEDLGITGDDAHELLIQLSEKYKIDFQGFEFKKYFSEEGVSIFVIFYLPIAYLFVITGLIRLIVYAIVQIFNKELAETILKIEIFGFYDKVFKRMYYVPKKGITIADLITSLVKGKFTERQAVKFVIIK